MLQSDNGVHFTILMIHGTRTGVHPTTTLEYHGFEAATIDRDQSSQSSRNRGSKNWTRAYQRAIPPIARFEGYQRRLTEVTRVSE